MVAMCERHAIEEEVCTFPTGAVERERRAQLRSAARHSCVDDITDELELQAHTKLDPEIAGKQRRYHPPPRFTGCGEKKLGRAESLVSRHRIQQRLLAVLKKTTSTICCQLVERNTEASVRVRRWFGGIKF